MCKVFSTECESASEISANNGGMSSGNGDNRSGDGVVKDGAEVGRALDGAAGHGVGRRREDRWREVEAAEV